MRQWQSTLNGALILAPCAANRKTRSWSWLPWLPPEASQSLQPRPAHAHDVPHIVLRPLQRGGPLGFEKLGRQRLPCSSSLSSSE